MFIEVVLILTLLTVTTVAQYIGFDQLAPFFQAFDWKQKNSWLGRITASACQIAMLLFGLMGEPNSPWLIGLVVAYFLHDAMHCTLYDHDITNYIHHAVGLAVAFLRETVMTPEQSYNAFLATMNLETTSPFLNATWLMRAAGYGDHPAFKYVAGFTLLFFGLMRVVVFPWLMYSRMDRVTTAVFSPFLVLNVYWFYKLILMAQRTLATNAGDDRRE
jgi:hypothetical protein